MAESGVLTQLPADQAVVTLTCCNARALAKVAAKGSSAAGDTIELGHLSGRAARARTRVRDLGAL